jgi:hypothetical protein
MNNNDQRLMVLSQQQQQQRRFPTHLAPKMAFHHGELTLDFMQGLVLAGRGPACCSYAKAGELEDLFG